MTALSAFHLVPSLDPGVLKEGHRHYVAACGSAAAVMPRPAAPAANQVDDWSRLRELFAVTALTASISGVESAHRIYPD
jgi:hypothetical protein